MTQKAEVKSWFSGWPERSPWRLYFTDDSENWVRERICPECRGRVAESESDWARALIGGLEFVFHGICHEVFQAEAAVRRIDWHTA